MRQSRVLRKIATVAVSPGSFSTTDLPRDYDYETIFIRITGGLQVTAAATSVRAEAPCQILPRMELVADGKNNLFSAPFWFTSLGNYNRQMTNQGGRAVTPPSGTAIATYQVEGIGAIDCATIDGLRPKDSNFRSAGLSLLQLRLTFGNAADCFVGGTVAYSNMYVEIFVSQIIETADAAGNITSPQALKKISFQEVGVTSSNANQEIRLPAGNQIKSILVRTEGLITAGEPVTTMLNGLQLASGLDVRMNLTGPQLRAKNSADYGSITAGYYIADLTSKGSAPVTLSDLWDVSGAAEPKLIADVVGGANGKLQAVITEYIVAGTPS